MQKKITQTKKSRLLQEVARAKPKQRRSLVEGVQKVAGVVGRETLSAGQAREDAREEVMLATVVDHVRSLVERGTWPLSGERVQGNIRIEWEFTHPGEFVSIKATRL